MLTRSVNDSFWRTTHAHTSLNVSFSRTTCRVQLILTRHVCDMSPHVSHRLIQMWKWFSHVVSHDSFSHVTRLTYDSFTCVISTHHLHVSYIVREKIPNDGRNESEHTRDMTHLHVSYDLFLHEWLIYMNDSFICVTWLFPMCDMTHSYVRHDSFVSVTCWLIPMSDMTHSYDLFLRVTWRIHMCDMTHS